MCSLLSAHTKRNKSKDELRDAKSPSTDLIPRFIIICGELKAAWGAELRKQHRPGPRGSQLNRDKQLRPWGSRMIEARRLVPDALAASSQTGLRAEGGARASGGDQVGRGWSTEQRPGKPLQPISWDSLRLPRNQSPYRGPARPSPL